jgi:hypothetical protein
MPLDNIKSRFDGHLTVNEFVNFGPELESRSRLSKKRIILQVYMDCEV